ncbi:MAG: cupin domain-containing protein [Ginsengibacter sp.]
MQQNITPQPKVIRHMLHDDGQFPNSNLFLLIYKEAIKLPDNDSSIFKKIFKSNNWTNSWLNGVYDYHHYHSITHEVLGIYEGNANVQFGGPNGIAEDVSKGDVIIIPAGVAHKCNSASDDFKCIGAYPDGNDYDIKKGEPSDRPEADENIRNVKLPDTDPVYGLTGPLILNWEMW